MMFEKAFFYIRVKACRNTEDLLEIDCKCCKFSVMTFSMFHLFLASRLEQKRGKIINSQKFQIVFQIFCKIEVVQGIRNFLITSKASPCGVCICANTVSSVSRPI